MGRPKKRVIVQCLQCAKLFEAFPCEIRKGGGKFCSRQCATRYRNINDNPTKSEEVRKKISKNHANVSGEKNPMYMRRGELAPGYIDGRNKFKGEVYRKIMLATGKEQVCQICGSKEKLNVHHIDGDRKNNNINNLAWLCAKCHLTIAHDYKRNEKGQFISSDLKQVQ